MLSLNNVALRRGTEILFENTSLTIHQGNKVGLIGANGSGKTSLFKLILAELEADRGSIDLPQGTTIAHMAQEVFGSNQPAIDYVLAGDDVYINIAGGMSIEEPAADLSVVAAVASSVRNRSLPASTAVFGEVGLSGEIRGISQAALRVREAAQMGFARVVMPAANVDGLEVAGCELVGVRSVGDALDQLMS